VKYNGTRAAGPAENRYELPVMAGICAADAFRENWMNYIPEMLGWQQDKPVKILDVGANLGQLLWAVIDQGYAPSYMGIEPHPTNYAYLSRTALINPELGMQIFPVAFTQNAGVGALLMRKTGVDVYASISDDTRQHSFYKARYPVILQPGDSVLKDSDFECPDLIKIDVEGAELSVMRGLSKTLLQHKPDLVFELLPNQETSATNDEESKVRDRNASDMKEFLAPFGYQYYQLLEAGPKKLSTLPAAVDIKALEEANILATTKNIDV
jgi:FkbM family methyltransferase